MKLDPLQLEQQLIDAGDRKGGLQDQRVARREALKPAFTDKKGRQVGPFRRGDRLRPEMSFAATIDDWSPAGQLDLKKLVPAKLQTKLDEALKEASHLKLIETNAGIREIIEYSDDETEAITAIEAAARGSQPEPAQLSIFGPPKGEVEGG